MDIKTNKTAAPTDVGRQVEGQPERVLIPNAGERTLVVRSRVGLYCPVSGAPKGEFAGGSGDEPAASGPLSVERLGIDSIPSIPIRANAQFAFQCQRV